jgi:cobalt/nickel transport system permease protein
VSAGPPSTDSLLHPGDSFLHRLPPEVKIAATVAFVLAVVATPARAWWAFAIDGLVLLAAAAVARLPARLVLGRLRIELPFLAFALFMPVVGVSPRVDVLGVSLSEPGLWAAWNIIVKGTLGVLAAIVLAGTTPVSELLTGLDRLRVPRVFTAIAGFMIRYLDVIAGEAARMRIARLSRGDDPRWLWQARAVTATAGTLFVRSYERGERVHLAMCSRGYEGGMPRLHERPISPHAWRVAAILPVLAASLMVMARVGAA